MKATSQLHALGQSLWLDNISRELLDNGTLKRYIAELSVTGLTSNPTIFSKAIDTTNAYDDAIAQKVKQGKTGEALFTELALEDLRRAAALFLPAYKASHGIDGWVSMEVSPLLANDTLGTIKEAKRLHHQAQCPNLFIKIPGTPAGVNAIEESIFAGIPINVTLLFSCEQYLATADAYLRGIQRRLDAGLNPKVNSVASIFVSRWDKAVQDKVPVELNNRLGVAISQRAYKAYIQRMSSPIWRKLADAGALPQRLLWASTGTKDPQLPLTYYVESLAAPHTINTMPEKTLHALAEKDHLNSVMSENDGDTQAILARFANAGIDIDQLATQLQLEGTQAFNASWRELLTAIETKGEHAPATTSTDKESRP